MKRDIARLSTDIYLVNRHPLSLRKSNWNRLLTAPIGASIRQFLGGAAVGGGCFGAVKLRDQNPIMRRNEM